MANSISAAGKVLLAPLAFLCLGGSAHAQEASTEVPDEIIVEAPRSIPLPRQRSSYTGAPIVITTVRIPVRHDDLDLTRPADQARFMTRVERVAESACKELDWLYPLNTDPDCVPNAVASGTATAKATIAAATRGR